MAASIANLLTGGELRAKNLRLGYKPLVTVGIPTYDRPEGLRRTLRHITNQTFDNLEIIVSDNCSSERSVAQIVEEFQKIDPRIKYVKQKTNVGAHRNFQFVLEHATGDFFMWAADDDEWDSNFILYCLENIGDCGTIMPGYKFINRFYGDFFKSTCVELPTTVSAYAALNMFLDNPFNHVLYGLHRRSAIQFILAEYEPFDWADSYLVMRLILDQGVVIKSQELLYTAGMDTPTYEHKPARKGGITRFTYWLPAVKVSRLVLSTNKLNLFQKVTIIMRWLWHLLCGFSALEKNKLPLFAFAASCLIKLVSLPRRLSKHF